MPCLKFITYFSHNKNIVSSINHQNFNEYLFNHYGSYSKSLVRQRFQESSMHGQLMTSATSVTYFYRPVKVFLGFELSVLKR